MTAFTQTPFKHVTIIGIGLIGSSLARVIRKNFPETVITAADKNSDFLATAKELGVADNVYNNAADAVKEADLVMLCVPVGACGAVSAHIVPHMKDGAVLSDVGSVKTSVVADVRPHVPPHIHFVAGHPVAGIEKSGPEHGFAELFEDRWFILTPDMDTPKDVLQKLETLWTAANMKIEYMTPEHHDKVMAIVSHVPHLIAYTIVGTADDLETQVKKEVIKYSAGGFRDFTRIAGSDPVMWRDIFLNNKEAVLDILQRFSEDLTMLQRAIRWDEGDTLKELFTRTRDIRNYVIEARQDQPEHEKILLAKAKQDVSGEDGH